jgi:hypothetical protein
METLFYYIPFVVIVLYTVFTTFFPNDWLELTYLKVSDRFQECIQNKKIATVCDRTNRK